MKQFIEIKGARENNLKNIDLKIPKDKITVFTGVSGSGKSSVVFDTLAQEAGRILNETYSNFIRTFLPKYTQPDTDGINNLTFTIAIDQKRLGGGSRSTLGTITDINSLIRLLYSRIGTPQIGPSFYFSFNDIHGMCTECSGIGRIIVPDEDKIIDRNKSLNEGAILLKGFKIDSWQWKMYADIGYFDLDKKINDYSDEEYKQLMYQEATKVDGLLANGLMTTYEGLITRFKRLYLNKSQDESKGNLKSFVKTSDCPVCEGGRFNDKVLKVKINGYSIVDFLAIEIDDLLPIVKEIKDNSVEPILESLIKKLEGLINIGLGYLRLDRETASLSGGESQRIKMIKHLTGSMVDVTYILDEPSVGLHPHDIKQVINTLQKLRDRGNTVIVVEHDPDIVEIADHIIDMGPKAGKKGGEVVFEGSYLNLLQSDTLTSNFIASSNQINTNPRQSNEYFTSSISNLHNLKNIALNVPKGIFTVVTGVAGSGKSTLVNGVFAKEFSQVVVIDQSAVGSNSRANTATYTGVFDNIRQLFATENNQPVGLFSYNSTGACENCKGTGIVSTELAFMEESETICEVCHGNRYQPEVLKYKYKDKSIVDILKLTITEALEFFEQKDILTKLQRLDQVGLEYMSLGQPLSTLSGGECQRLKLATELKKSGNIYLMDEPTTGLHPSDIQKILFLINTLVKKGNTVVVIEHNLDIIRQADWLIDIGPGAGKHGGQIVFEGSVEELKKNKDSITAQFI